ncbi:MAG: methyltransferase, partial [Clostridia bacterium]|nr:methyltransferase [Clostridia bacterium]
CGLQDSVTVICGDYLTCEQLRAASYDRVVCNPPYRRLGSGAESKSEAARIARSEQCAALGGMLSRAAKILKNGGCLSLCLRPERLAECLALMRSCGIEPKRLRMVQQRAQTRPWLVLVEGKRGAHTGLDVEPVLLLEQGGGISQEMRRIYQGVRADTAVAPELLNRNFQ